MAPSGRAACFGASTSRLQCPSTRADADTINTGCNFPTTEMRETTGDLRWDRVRVHLLCLTVENAIDRATGGKRLDAALPEMVANHASADRPRPGWRQRLAPPDVVRFEGIRCCRRGGRRTSSVRLKPLGLGDLLAMLPLLQPTLCPAQLPAEHRNRVTGQGALKPLWTAPLQGCRRSSRFPPLLLPSCMTICSRCHGTLLFGRVGKSSCLERLPGIPGALSHFAPMALAASCSVAIIVANDLLSVRALALVTRCSLRLSTRAGRPVGGAPISTTAFWQGPAIPRAASTSTKSEGGRSTARLRRPL